MNNLIIDCSAGMSLYVLKDEKIFSFIDENEKRHTDDLLVALDDLINKAGLKISDINNIGVCVGPGSFTGVRVAISICKGLSIAVNAKVFQLTNFDCYFDGFDNQIIVLEGFSKFIYTRKIFDGKVIDACEDIDAFSGFVKQKHPDAQILVPNEKVQKLLKNYEINAKICENYIITAFNQKFKTDEFIEINQIAPVYLRASQAEIERNKKLSSEK